MQCIIPTHNRPEKLGELLQSFVMIKEASGQLPDVIHIIENGSRVAERLVAKYENVLPVKYHFSSIGNKSAALNAIVLAERSTDLLVFFDDDIKLVDTELFDNINAAAEEYGDQYFFGGEVIPDFEIIPSPDLLPYMPKSNTGMVFGHTDNRVMSGPHFLGCNWAVFHHKIYDLGGFSSDFGPGSKSEARGQETDAQFRLIESGITPVAVPGTKVAHYVPSHAISRKWLLDRKRKSGSWYGQKNGSPLKRLYWNLRIYFELPMSFTLGSAMRIARFRGFLDGYRIKRNSRKPQS